ncbi:MAG: hypothetical protein M1549_00540 [Candidatus Dependentiae bacterium]|nr:hypothetical protein [Candidatus Dependentiae bacterium]
MKRVFKGSLLLGLALAGGLCAAEQLNEPKGPMPTSEALRALFEECELTYINPDHVKAEAVACRHALERFTAIKYGALAFSLATFGYVVWDMYAGASTRALHTRVEALEANRAARDKDAKLPKLGWLTSFAKGVFAGLPTSIASQIIGGAALGFVASHVPASELFKSEPSFKWFLANKTSFSAECGMLLFYYHQQATHYAFCIEVMRLVRDVEKILGYLDYHVGQLKKGAAIAAKTLTTRSGQLIDQMNRIVDAVARKEYDDMVTKIQLMGTFVGEILVAGVLS